MRFKRKLSLLVLLLSSLFGAALPELANAELKLKWFGLTEGRLVFTYIQGGSRDIYMLDFEKLSIAPLVKSPKTDEYPTISPDGTKVVFYSDMSDDREIFVVNSDGSGLERLTNSPGLDEDPDWSPDGNSIVFHSERSGKGSNLYLMDANGKNPRQLTTVANKNTAPRYSPRGDEILYSSDGSWPGWDIMLYEFSTKKSKQLTNGFRSYCRGNWSPDGAWFTFSYGAGTEIDLYRIKKGEKTPERLTNRLGREYDPVWLDDGERFFFVGESGKKTDDFQVFLMNVKTKEVTQITTGTGAVRHISFNPLPGPSPLVSGGQQQ